mgnify:CR=1 FL=1
MLSVLTSSFPQRVFCLFSKYSREIELSIHYLGILEMMKLRRSRKKLDGNIFMEMFLDILHISHFFVLC